MNNLDDEAGHIALDDAEVAPLVLQRIFHAIARLLRQQALGWPGRVPGTRGLIVTKARYLIPYRIRNEVIEILRVFHTSRRPPDRW